MEARVVAVALYSRDPERLHIRTVFRRSSRDLFRDGMGADCIGHKSLGSHGIHGYRTGRLS